MYIYQMPFRPRQDLVNILNSGDGWRNLGGSCLGYSVVELDNFALWACRPGGSPADAMLSHWGTRNHTVLELFKHLRSMGHLQGMEALKSLVPEKYHADIRPRKSSATLTTTSVQNAPIVSPPPPPPIQYAQAQRLVQDNLDINSPKKSYGMKKFQCEVDDFDESSTVSHNGVVKAVNKPKSSAIDIIQSATSNHAKGSEGTSCSKLKQRTPSGIPKPDSEIFLNNVPLDELKEACGGFSMKNLIGKGGFGEVYRGRRHNQDVAVKRIRGDKRVVNDPNYHRYVNQFIVELQAMHSFPADNILQLLAFSYIEDLSQDPCLVYQYMPNGSVADRLKCREGTPPLTWDQRVNIATGTAKGLCHLHANNIIHGDIKSGNILLDRHFEPKIGDFGLARGGSDSPDYSCVTVSTILGTAWYLPDDYKRNHQLHWSIDTFCYGIFLFELITGHGPSWFPPNSDNLPLRDIMLTVDNPQQWVDPKVEYSHWSKLLFFFGRDCAQERRAKRPDMDRVFKALESTSQLPEPMVLQMFYDKKAEGSTTNGTTPQKGEKGNVNGAVALNGACVVQSPNNGDSSASIPALEELMVESANVKFEVDYVEEDEATSDSCHSSQESSYDVISRTVEELQMSNVSDFLKSMRISKPK